MILIFSITKSVRLEYIAKLLLTELYGIPVRFTTNRVEFLESGGAKINYSGTDLGTGLWIVPGELLFEEGIARHEPGVSSIGSMPVMFEKKSGEPGFAFDAFAASFYMVSRYEEYLSSARDNHYRFPPQSSMASAYGFLSRPVVNEWADALVAELKKINPEIEPRKPGFNFISTIDLDHLLAHKGRSLMRLMGGWMHALSKGTIGKVVERFLVVTGMERDPYDTYEYIRDVHAKYGISPVFFVLCADYGGNDNNISPFHPLFKKILSYIKTFGEIGIHPSIRSNENPFKVEQEISILVKTIGTEVTRSRQHFLILDLPHTYRRLARAGIRDDYSMGYASMNGFRAGIASPFNFFDLISNEEIPVRVHPVTFMDVTLMKYLHLSPDEGISEIKQLMNAVCSAGGECIGLWHNESLSGRGEWKRWREVFESMLQHAQTLKP